MWWNGPKWLSLPKSEWPDSNCWKEICEDDCETVDSNFTNSTVTNMCVNTIAQPFGINVEKFSSMLKVLRVTAYASRFVKNTRSRLNRKSNNLTSEEINDAEIMWLK